MLTLKRMTGKGLVVEERIRPARSFTQNLMELLYIAHAQILYASPRTVYDITGSVKYADSEYANCGNLNRTEKGTLLVASPGGRGQVWVPGEGNNPTGSSVNAMSPPPQTLLPGELIGIQVGGSNTAVTPQDRKLSQRIPHGQRGPTSPAASIDSITTGDNSQYNLPVTIYYLPNRQIDMSSIKFLMYRSGTPGTITLQVYACTPSYNSRSLWSLLATATTDGNTLPTGAPYEWREFILGSPVTLIPGMGYAFALSSAASMVYVRLSSASNIGYQYPRVMNSISVSYLFLYDLWGTTLREIEYGPCEVGSLSVVNPNASFVIRRLFSNTSGGSITIRECGIYAGCSWRADYGGSFPLCIARDVISPDIVVNNGEILEVKYTPQITV
jgi:hypothetical protein